MQDPALWMRIAAHRLDAKSGTAPYSVKLAEAEGWSADFTARVIEEYRRFVYLSQISNEQVTPPVVVDRAWHMHLTFTRDYWDVFCPNVLQKPLHHEPCKGEEEMSRYRAQFDATRTLYEQEFGHRPPALWGRQIPVPPEVWNGLYVTALGLAGGAYQVLREGPISIDWFVLSLVAAAGGSLYAWRGWKRSKSDPEFRSPVPVSAGGAGCGGGGSYNNHQSGSDAGGCGGGGCGG